MEHELWILLYHIAKTCDDPQPWRLGYFFRLRNRSGVFLGSGARPAYLLGVQTE
jgi:hypothetical protein